MASHGLTVPGVYARPSPRASSFLRVRTDVAGFVGVAGPEHLHEAKPIDDWRSYLATYLPTGQPPAGSRLAEAVREFFANGGSRCWVVNVGESLDGVTAEQLGADLLGIPREPPVTRDGSLVRRVGLELLLTIPEVSLVLLPELHARVPQERSRVADDLPPASDRSKFASCMPSGVARPDQQPPPEQLDIPLFSTPELLRLQQLLLARLARPGDAWRVFTLLEPPLEADAQAARAWRDALGDHGHAALYWPWVLAQDKPYAPTRTVPPSFAMAGVFARVDLARGPQQAPANQPLRGVVGLCQPVDDPVQAELYPCGINLLRSFAGRGVVVWGARTLLWNAVNPQPELEPLCFINARRCLTAIERNADHIGQRIAFEPNDAIARLRLVHELSQHLLGVFESGALLGAEAEQAFFVRSDASNNPRGTVEQGQLLCEVGVALAAPAEFIVFRLGRREGVVEIEEV